MRQCTDQNKIYKHIQSSHMINILRKGSINEFIPFLILLSFYRTSGQSWNKCIYSFCHVCVLHLLLWTTLCHPLRQFRCLVLVIMLLPVLVPKAQTSFSIKIVCVYFLFFLSAYEVIEVDVKSNDLNRDKSMLGSQVQYLTHCVAV